jgi:hypothetical protein
VGQAGRVGRIGRLLAALSLLAAGCLVFAESAFAQSLAPVLEVTGGYAGFVDDAMIGHGVFGGSARWQVTPRLGIGPEVTYMIGPRYDRDLFVTGNVTWDFVRTAPPRAGRVVPYVLGGAGYFRHFDRLGPLGRTSYATNEGTFTAGGGARVWVSPRVYVGGEWRVGWELHTRVGGTVGILFAR